MGLRRFRFLGENGVAKAVHFFGKNSWERRIFFKNSEIIPRKDLSEAYVRKGRSGGRAHPGSVFRGVLLSTLRQDTCT